MHARRRHRALRAAPGCSRWPWPLSPLTSRAIGAWLVSFGLAGRARRRRSDLDRLRAPTIAYIVFGVAELVALARFRRHARLGRPRGLGVPRRSPCWSCSPARPASGLRPWAGRRDTGPSCWSSSRSDAVREALVSGAHRPVRARLRVVPAASADDARRRLLDVERPACPGRAPAGRSRRRRRRRARRCSPAARGRARTRCAVPVVRWGDWRHRPADLRGARPWASWTAGSSGPRQTPDEEFHRAVTEILEEWSARHGRRLRGGADDRRPVVAALAAAARHVHPQPHPARLLRRATPDGGRRCSTGSASTDPALPVVQLRFRPRAARCCRTRRDLEIADAFGLMHAARRTTRSSTSSSSARGRPGWAPPSTPRRRGCATLVLEPEAVGGQAGTSSLIRNYLGFPTGISGNRLTFGAYQQAWAFGTTFHFMRPATGTRPWTATCAGVGPQRRRPRWRGRTVVVATGASYRRLGVPALEALQGRGVFYGAAVAEAPRDARTARLRRRRRQLGGAGGRLPRPLRRPGHRARPPGRRSPRRCRTT